ncbi:MAG: class D sortase, partial [Chloroflexi bacterium]|nr:class D sortase [Chloroflexota bacterium]
RLARTLAHHQKIAVPKGPVAANLVGREPATRIVIPKIAVDAPVVETPPADGVWEVADWAVGHLTTTPQPGSPGNMALSAHDDIKGEIFKRLDELRPGDEIRLYTRHEVYSYIVTNQQVVDPSDIAVLAPTAAPTVTLISCTPYWVDTQRLVVQATLKMHAAV